ncbi:hypothetical protein [Terrarubrum flagellatum]|uniref:hypothetical protein n=1 Tax=Terrirubrum flagellatum TaxID=2895980 RepID=UPI003144E52E
MTSWFGSRALTVSLALVAMIAPSRAQQSPPRPRPPGIAVDVANQSEPQLCAEKDNVSILFTSPEARRFTIEAAHPNYINTLQRDNWDADWTNCDMTGDPSFPAQPRKITFYESIDLWLVGYTFPSFWRKNDVPVRVGDRVEHGLHLVQVWMLTKDRSEEVLVVYPPDGYWRARPLPPQHLRWSAYGSSFVVGPIEQDSGRPVVNLKEIAFDPKTKTFTMTYADGSTGTLKMATIDDNRMVLEVELSKAVSGGKPFGLLRSMYVTEFNADVARIAVKEPTAKSWREENIMAFGKAHATDVWTGRLVPSRHNTSAPDMVFHHFGK